MFSDSSQILIVVLFSLYALFIGGAQVLQLVIQTSYSQQKFVRLAWVGDFILLIAAIGTWLVPMLTRLELATPCSLGRGVTLLGLIVSVALAPETRAMSLEEATSLNS
jgi:putative MFS transporter